MACSAYRSDIATAYLHQRDAANSPVLPATPSLYAGISPWRYYFITVRAAVSRHLRPIDCLRRARAALCCRTGRRRRAGAPNSDWAALLAFTSASYRSLRTLIPPILRGAQTTVLFPRLPPHLCTYIPATAPYWAYRRHAVPYVCRGTVCATHLCLSLSRLSFFLCGVSQRAAIYRTSLTALPYARRYFTRYRGAGEHGGQRVNRLARAMRC